MAIGFNRRPRTIIRSDRWKKKSQSRPVNDEMLSQKKRKHRKIKSFIKYSHKTEARILEIWTFCLDKNDQFNYDSIISKPWGKSSIAHIRYFTLWSNYKVIFLKYDIDKMNIEMESNEYRNEHRNR